MSCGLNSWRLRIYICIEITVVEPPFSKLTMESGKLVAEQVFLIHPPFLYFLRVLTSTAGDPPQLSRLLLYNKPPCSSAASENSGLPFLTVLWGRLRVGLAGQFFCSIWHQLGVTHSACLACGWAGLEAPRSFYSTLAELVFLLRPCHTSWDGCSHSGWWTGLRILPWEQASKKEEAEASSPLKSGAKKSKEKGVAEEEMVR